MTVANQILLGALGGLIPDIVRVVRNRYDPTLPVYLKSIVFYVGLVLGMALGALASVLLHAQTPQEALALGFGAPEILTRLLGGQPAAALPKAGTAAAVPRTLGRWWGE